MIKSLFRIKNPLPGDNLCPGGDVYHFFQPSGQGECQPELHGIGDEEGNHAAQQDQSQSAAGIEVKPAAAAAVASGLANIKAILAVKTDGKSTSMPAVGATMMTAAPAVIQQVPVMRSLTGASEDERLNAIADNTGQTASRPVKAYVVQSELEGEQLYAETREKESSF